MVDGIQSNSSPLTLSNQCANISRLSAAEFRGKKLSKWSPYIKISCSNFISRFSRDFGGINPLSKYTNSTSTNSLNFETKANNQPYGKNAVLSVGCFARLNLTDNIGNIGFLTNPIFWIVVAVWETEWRGYDCWLCQNSFYFKVCFAPFSQKIKWIFICPACDMFPTRKWLTTRVSQYHCYAVTRYGPIPCFEASYAFPFEKVKI